MSYPTWITLVGKDFSERTIVHIASPGESVDGVVDDRERLRLRHGDSLDVLVTLGAEPSGWTVQVKDVGATVWSGPVSFEVISPVPKISSITVSDPDSLGMRMIRVASASVTRDSYITWDGKRLATEPIRTSTNASALTVGLEASVVDWGTSSFWHGLDPQYVQVVTPPPGGGTSTLFAAPIPWTPLYARWELIVGGLALLALFGAGVGWASWRRKAGTLDRLVSERTADLKERTDELDQANAKREATIRWVTHDIKTPLTLAVSEADELAEQAEMAGHAEYVSGLSLVKSELLHVNAFINALAELAQHEGGMSTLQCALFDLAELVRESVAAFAPEMERKGLRLVASVPPSLPVYADPRKLDAICRNLLGNALKYVPAGKDVTATLRREGDAVVLVVEDTGGTIPSEAIPRLFQVAYRAHQEHSPEKGSGLGLALVKVFAEQHGGTAEVENEAGVLTQFTVTLPERVREELPELADAGTSKAGASTQEAEDTKPLVLVVENQASLRALLCRDLGGAYRVTDASGGAAALELARENPPDAIVTDLAMPGGGGKSLIEALRAEPWGQSMPILVLSGEQTDGADLLASGAQAVLHKPWHLPDLLAQLATLLSLRDGARGRVALPDGSEIASEDAEYVKRLYTTIDTHMSQSGFNVKALAKEIGMGTTTLVARTKAALGETPKVTLLRRRLQRAHDLLASGKRERVGEVMREVGLTSPRRFREAYRTRYGENPSETVGQKGTIRPEMGGDSPNA